MRRACGCFTSETPVWTERGAVPISGVVEGQDRVLTRDEGTGKEVYRRVLRTFVREGAPLVLVTVIGTARGETTLRTTEEHPFWVEAEGAAGRGGWVGAGQLRPGQLVSALGGAGMVESVRFTTERATVYNLELEGLHSYRVGTDGVLVHNGAACHPVGVPSLPATSDVDAI